MPKAGGGFEYEYFIKDHLGNTRLTVQDSLGIAAIKQQDHYYPFGMVMTGQSWQSPTYLQNRYLYNGKVVAERKSRPIGKFQDELGLDWYDYRARFYDPAIARWMSVDPLAEKYHTMSPYNYTANNPLRFIDPDGMRIIGADPKSAQRNIDILREIFKDFSKIQELFHLDGNQVRSINADDLKAAIEAYSDNKNFESLQLLANGFASIINDENFSIWTSTRTTDDTWDESSSIEKAGLKDDFIKNIGDWMFDNKLPKDQAGTLGINKSNALVVLDMNIDKELFYNGSKNGEKTNIYDMFVHEVLGEATQGCSYEKNCMEGYNSLYPVQVENIYRRMKGAKTFRTGEDHNGPFENATGIPPFLKK